MYTHLPIHNRGSFTGSPRYLYIDYKGMGLVQKHLFSLSGEPVQVDWIEIIKNNTAHGNQMMRMGGMVGGAVVSGLVGALMMAGAAKTAWDIEVDVHFEDGRTVETRLSTKEQVDLLEPFMRTEDPRAKKKAKATKAEYKSFLAMVKGWEKEFKQAQKERKELLKRNQVLIDLLGYIGIKDQEDAIKCLDYVEGWDRDPQEVLTQVQQLMDKGVITIE